MALEEDDLRELTLLISTRRLQLIVCIVLGDVACASRISSSFAPQSPPPFLPSKIASVHYDLINPSMPLWKSNFAFEAHTQETLLDSLLKVLIYVSLIFF